jgi:RimJ/RimL family protein N-acetyltransferase
VGEAGEGFAVHRLRPEHWRRWRDLRLRALAESPEAFSSTVEREGRVPDEAWRQRTRAFAEPVGDGTMLVAIEAADGGWIGCAGAIVDGGVPHLISVWAPERRGRGVGGTLVEAVVAWARAEGYDRLRLDVVRGQDAAVRLYRRLGFRPTGRVTPVPRAPDLLEEEMVLPLA